MHSKPLIIRQRSYIINKKIMFMTLPSHTILFFFFYRGIRATGPGLSLIDGVLQEILAQLDTFYRKQI